MTTYVLPLPSMRERLLARRIITNTGCWEWGGSRRNGYGRVSIGGRLLTVSRVAAAIWLEGFEYNSPLEVCHRCDNPPCFNPSHLFIGSRADNMADAASKDRLLGSVGPRATRHPRRKPCAACGADYEPPENHRGRSQVCSPACLAKLRSSQRAGKGIKLTAETAQQIREHIANGVKGAAVARMYDVSPATVSLIRSGKIWGGTHD